MRLTWHFLRAFCAHGRSHIFWHPVAVYSDNPFYFIEHRQSKVNIWSSMKLKIENKQKQLLVSTGRTPWWDSLGNMALEEVFLSFDVYRFFSIHNSPFLHSNIWLAKKFPFDFMKLEWTQLIWQHKVKGKRSTEKKRFLSGIARIT